VKKGRFARNFQKRDIDRKNERRFEKEQEIQGSTTLKAARGRRLGRGEGGSGVGEGNTTKAKGRVLSRTTRGGKRVDRRVSTLITVL